MFSEQRTTQKTIALERLTARLYGILRVQKHRGDVLDTRLTEERIKRLIDQAVGMTLSQIKALVNVLEVL